MKYRHISLLVHLHYPILLPTVRHNSRLVIDMIYYFLTISNSHYLGLPPTSHCLFCFDITNYYSFDMRAFLELYLQTHYVFCHLLPSVLEAIPFKIHGYIYKHRALAKKKEAICGIG